MSDNRYYIITPEQAVTLHGLFLERVQRTPEAIAYRYFDAPKNAWLSLTWAQVHDQVARWQAALMSEGLAAGDRVGIMLRNCPQWVMFDQAAMSMGLVVVPLYTVDRADSVAYIINDASVKVLLFESAEQWKELRTVREQLACVQRMISLDKIAGQSENFLAGHPDETRLQWAEEWLSQSMPDSEQAKLGWERVRDRDSLATIIYTSGTTGRPKGVMLSHYNIIFNAHSCLDTFAVRQDDYSCPSCRCRILSSAHWATTCR